MSFDPVNMQYDIAGLLASDPRFQRVNVKSYRKMRLDSEMDYRMLFNTPTGGRTGSAVLVGQPTATPNSPGVTGPILNWLFPIACLENYTLSMDPVQGSGISAEELVQTVLDVLQLWQDDRTGTLQVSGSLQPESDWVFPGCLGYRVNFKMIGGKSQQIQRLTKPSYSVSAGNFTLACGNATASIYFTMDESFPSGSAGGNANSSLYVGPVPAVSGAVVRAVAYADGYNTSQAIQFTIP